MKERYIMLPTVLGDNYLTQEAMEDYFAEMNIKSKKGIVFDDCAFLKLTESQQSVLYDELYEDPKYTHLLNDILENGNKCLLIKVMCNELGEKMLNRVLESVTSLNINDGDNLNHYLAVLDVCSEVGCDIPKSTVVGEGTNLNGTPYHSVTFNFDNKPKQNYNVEFKQYLIGDGDSCTQQLLADLYNLSVPVEDRMA